MKIALHFSMSGEENAVLGGSSFHFSHSQLALIPYSTLSNPRFVYGTLCGVQCDSFFCPTLLFICRFQESLIFYSLLSERSLVMNFLLSGLLDWMSLVVVIILMELCS